jgi:hypothetical protein
MPVRFSAPLRWRWLALLPALGCLACSGGERLNSVQGKVLHKNKPAAGILVTFHPTGANQITAVRPVGTTGEDGTFTLTTGTKDGALAGSYVVTLVWPKEMAPRKKEKGPISRERSETRDRLDGAYANPKKSAFKVQIKEGINQLDPFQLMK